MTSKEKHSFLKTTLKELMHFPSNPKHTVEDKEKYYIKTNYVKYAYLMHTITYTYTYLIHTITYTYTYLITYNFI